MPSMLNLIIKYPITREGESQFTRSSGKQSSLAMAGAQLLWAKSIAFLALLSLSTNSAQSRLTIPSIFPPKHISTFRQPTLDTQPSASPSLGISALTRVHHVRKSSGVNMATALPPDFERSLESRALTIGGGGGGNAQISFGSPGIISAGVHGEGGTNGYSGSGGSSGATISNGRSLSGMIPGSGKVIDNPNANTWRSDPTMVRAYQSPIGIPASPDMGGVFPPPIGVPTTPGGELFPPPLGLPTIPSMGEPPFPPPLGLPPAPGMGEPPFPPPLGLPPTPGMGEPFPPPLGLPTTPGMGEPFPPHDLGLPTTPGMGGFYPPPTGIPIAGYRVPIPLHEQYGAESPMGSTPETNDVTPAMNRAMAPTQATSLDGNTANSLTSPRF